MSTVKKYNGNTSAPNSINSTLLRKYDALKAENRNLKENLFIMSNPDHYKKLLETMARVESGEASFVSFSADEFKAYNKGLSKDED